ncbi:nuclear transport factor 2 family protein [Streptomyces sp. KMM 9044]|uniref:nuclear transport factor 2 family protein n=1 Tax=Streptomyces sp. KMM 9044 TaxID=2744474 RepID=UPI002150E39F|nr:nuclear transport factor 2 family protein [Streptomyces sp. KMM 9044]WAX81467.1 nuclear transport factor 2 family protein [Streptomyces sp. KMM 9044]
MRAFREAVEAHDMDAAEALLAEDVVFSSPVVFKPYTGRPVTAAILHAVAEVFEDFRYVREVNDANGRDHVLVFTARVGDRAVEGCDIVHVDDHGRIDRLTVMVRPLSGAQALQAAMAAKFDQIARAAQDRSA